MQRERWVGWSRFQVLQQSNACIVWQCLYSRVSLSELVISADLTNCQREREQCQNYTNLSVWMSCLSQRTRLKCSVCGYEMEYWIHQICSVGFSFFFIRFECCYYHYCVRIFKYTRHRCTVRDPSVLLSGLPAGLRRSLFFLFLLIQIAVRSARLAAGARISRCWCVRVAVKWCAGKFEYTLQHVQAWSLPPLGDGSRTRSLAGFPRQLNDLCYSQGPHSLALHEPPRVPFVYARMCSGITMACDTNY